MKLQGDYFYTQARMTLKGFFTELWPELTQSDEPTAHVPNLRYQQPGGLSADIDRIFGRLEGTSTRYFGYEAFKNFSHHWEAPRFLPKVFSFPFTMFRAEPPNQRWFYDWGIYCSPKVYISMYECLNG